MPKRLAKKNIGSIPNGKFRCNADFANHSCIMNADELCEPTNECPTDCVCSGTVVDCKSKNMYDIPANFPVLTTEM